MPYSTIHMGVEVSFVENPKGIINMVIAPAFAALNEHIKIGVVTIHPNPIVPRETPKANGK